MNRDQLLKALKELGINENNIDVTPLTAGGATAIRLVNNSGNETLFTASDVYDGGEWTEAQEKRENWLVENFA